jgi:general secretion pathway protein D
MKRFSRRTAIGLLLVLALYGCAAKSAFKKGESAARRDDWDAAVVHYTRAAHEAPDNIEYRMALQRALSELSAAHLKKGRQHLAAEELEQAIAEFNKASGFDPSNQLAQDLLQSTREKLRKREEMRQETAEFEARRRRAQQLLAPEPQLEPSSEAPINIKFADTSLQKIFEALSQLSGVNILFDEAFRDKRVSIDLVDVSFREALDKLMLINRLFYKVVDPATIIIIPDNTQKRRQYDELVLRTFYITNAEVNTIANMLRTIVGIQRVQPNPELKTITLRATRDQVAVAERIIGANDKTKPELILDIEILEVNRSRLLEFGLRAAEYNVGLAFSPAGSTVSGPNVSTRLNRLAAVDASDFVLTFPNSITYRLFKSMSEAEVLASPKLRATEAKKAELKLGQEVPIPVTSFVSQFGVPGGVPTTPVTSFQYRNVGLNATITPRISVDGTIELELLLEISSLQGQRTIGGIDLPVFGTRSVNNTVRLKDGETNLIGGLIQAEDRKTTSGIPGLIDIPFLGRFFGSNTRDVTRSEVVFSVTPRLIRAPLITEEDLSALPMGTDQQVTVPGLRSPLFEPPPPRPPEPQAEQPLGTPPPAPPGAPQPPAPPPPAEGPLPSARPEAPATPAPAPAEPAPAATPISVLFSPPAATVDAEDEVELVLVAGGATNLSSGEITIVFDAEGLRPVKVDPGPFLTIDGKEVTFTPLIEAGRIRIQFARREDTTGLRGSGQIARVVFQALAPGPARIVSASGALMDPAGGRIPASFAAARITVQ